MLKNARNDKEVAEILGVSWQTITKNRVSKRRNVRDFLAQIGYLSVAHLEKKQLNEILAVSPEIKTAGRPKKEKE